MTRLIALALILFGLCGAVSAQEAGDAPETLPCGGQTISIARMQWPSAAILAQIHALIIADSFGCATQVVAGDLNATTSSMATTGQPLVAPEVWLGRVASIWNSALEAGSIRQAAASFSGGELEGWFVPDYVAENNPDLTSAASLIDHWQVFAEGGNRATLLSCPADWACAIFNRNLLRAHGLDKRFEVSEPASRFEMDNTIAQAVSRREPILFYYWQPNSVLSQFDFVPLDMGAYDADALSCLASVTCDAPKPSAFPLEQVSIVFADALFEIAPEIVSYLQGASMPLAEMNALLAYMSETGASPEDTARNFVDTRSEIWSAWVER